MSINKIKIKPGFTCCICPGVMGGLEMMDLMTDIIVYVLLILTGFGFFKFWKENDRLREKIKELKDELNNIKH